MKQQLSLSIAVFLIALLVMRVWFLDEILTPAVVSVSFTLIVSIVLALVWRNVAERSPENLPTFYTASSGGRMLLALAIMFVYYLINGHGAMLSFFLVFMVFYLVSLTHHSVFFARLSNRL